jgi:hypothetical protein
VKLGMDGLGGSRQQAFSPICAIFRSQEEAQNLKMGPNVMRRLLCAPLLK